MCLCIEITYSRHCSQDKARDTIIAPLSNSTMSSRLVEAKIHWWMDGWIKWNRTFVAPVSVNIEDLKEGHIEAGDVQVTFIVAFLNIQVQGSSAILLLSLNVDDSDNEGVIFSFKFILFTERTSFIHSLNSTGSLHLTQLISSIHPSIHLTDDPGECQSYWQPQSAAASSEHAMRIGKQIVMNYETHTHTNLNPTHSTQPSKFHIRLTELTSQARSCII